MMPSAAPVGHDLLTPRLRLRPPADRDLEPFALMCADEEVMRYIALGRALDRGGAELGFAVLQDHFGRDGRGLLTVEERTTGDYLGFAGTALVPAHSIGGGSTEIGWRLRRAAWGRGLATEAGAAVRDHAFTTLGLAELIALVQPANARSCRVAEKLGMHPDGEGPGPRGEPVRLFRLAAPAAAA